MLWAMTFYIFYCHIWLPFSKVAKRSRAHLLFLARFLNCNSFFFFWEIKWIHQWRPTATEHTLRNKFTIKGEHQNCQRGGLRDSTQTQVSQNSKGGFHKIRCMPPKSENLAPRVKWITFFLQPEMLVVFACWDPRINLASERHLHFRTFREIADSWCLLVLVSYSGLRSFRLRKADRSFGLLEISEPKL